MNLIHWLMSHRSLSAIILLPIFFLYDVFWNIFCKLVLWNQSDPKLHDKRVQWVQQQVRNWVKLGDGRKMCTARPGWMSISQQTLHYKTKSYQVEVNLVDILGLDEGRAVVKCEPMVTVRRLLDYLVVRGWTVPIVPEIGDLTIGGLVMGGGIESTSHKFGLWHNICLSYEMVLADGSCITCTKDHMEDLYWAIPWSYGTLGFLTAVELSVIPLKPWVKLTYCPTFSLEDTMEVFHRETIRDSGNDSVEGIMFTKSSAVVMTGDFVEEEQVDQEKINRLGLWFKPWFYSHVETVLEAGKIRVEFVPTYQFFFRHNRPYYWLTQYFVPFGNSSIFRYLFGWLLPYNFGLLKWFNVNFVKEETGNFVLQDFGIPLRHLKTAVEFFHEEVQIYPLWLCPANGALDNGPLRAKDSDPIHIDIGIYGFSEKQNFDAQSSLRRMEGLTRDLNGYQALYAETLMTREEFEEMFDLSHYRKVRGSLALCEEAFPEVYEKVSKIGRK